MLGDEFGGRVFLPFFIFSQSPFSGEKVRCLDITCTVDSVVLPSAQLQVREILMEAWHVRSGIPFGRMFR
jgi:hypothetical protein